MSTKNKTVRVAGCNLSEVDNSFQFARSQLLEGVDTNRKLLDIFKTYKLNFNFLIYMYKQLNTFVKTRDVNMFPLDINGPRETLGKNSVCCRSN